MTALQPPSTNPAEKLYDRDYLEWITTTAAKLRSQDYTQVDWDNLIEEMEDMGRRERQSLEVSLQGVTEA